MSYHRDYHWFDFDDHHLDMMYPMTDLDHLIAQYGTEEALNKFKKPMKYVTKSPKYYYKITINPFVYLRMKKSYHS